MPDKPLSANTQDLADTEYDAERRARVLNDRGADPKKNAPVADNRPEADLSPNGTAEAAAVKREPGV